MNTRTVLAGLLVLLFIILLAPVLLVSFLIRFQSPIIDFSRAYFGLVWRLLGFKVVIAGREHVRPGVQTVYMANHQSFIDGPLLFWAIPGALRVILKKSIFRLPVIGWCMRFVGFVPVDRKRLRGGWRSLDRAADLMNRHGYSFLIFPEGTRTRDGRLQAFKRGGFILALQSGAPIVPVAVRGTYDLMPRGSVRIRGGTIAVRFFPPVPVRDRDPDSIPALIDSVRRVVSSGLDAKENSP